MKTCYIILFALLGLTAFSQQASETRTYQDEYSSEFVFYKTDTFLIVRYSHYENDPGLSLECHNSYLYEFIDNESVLVFENSDECIPVDYEDGAEFSIKYFVDLQYDKLVNPEVYEDYFEEQPFEYIWTNTIRPIKNNVLLVSKGMWSYTGGAHGQGYAEYEFYDLDSHEYFEITDSYTEDVLEFIYERVKENFFKAEIENVEYMGELDERTEGQRVLDPGQYLFDETGLIIEIQMYQTLFGVDDFYIGYNNWTTIISYLELEPYMIKGGPIDKMLKE